ncbi:hypothetical protein B0H10DRAFT_1964124 [Mycena sp. CBHHK59/15]|nr:hypothetical protein B0H10DRAFT_1964124 [Mycena sp. CBHHK59/15]
MWTQMDPATPTEPCQGAKTRAESPNGAPNVALAAKVVTARRVNGVNRRVVDSSRRVRLGHEMGRTRRERPCVRQVAGPPTEFGEVAGTRDPRTQERRDAPLDFGSVGQDRGTSALRHGAAATRWGWVRSAERGGRRPRYARDCPGSCEAYGGSTTAERCGRTATRISSRGKEKDTGITQRLRAAVTRAWAARRQDSGQADGGLRRQTRGKGAERMRRLASGSDVAGGVRKKRLKRCLCGANADGTHAQTNASRRVGGGGEDNARGGSGGLRRIPGSGALRERGCVAEHEFQIMRVELAHGIVLGHMLIVLIATWFSFPDTAQRAGMARTGAGSEASGTGSAPVAGAMCAKGDVRDATKSMSAKVFHSVAYNKQPPFCITERIGKIIGNSNSVFSGSPLYQLPIVLLGSINTVVTAAMAQYSHGGYGTMQPPFCGTERGSNYVEWPPENGDNEHCVRDDRVIGEVIITHFASICLYYHRLDILPDADPVHPAETRTGSCGLTVHMFGSSTYILNDGRSAGNFAAGCIVVRHTMSSTEADLYAGIDFEALLSSIEGLEFYTMKRDGRISPHTRFICICLDRKMGG